MLEEVFQLRPTRLPLSQIYLDPNNPRFAHEEPLRVSDGDIDQELLQSDLKKKMEKEHAVDRLKDSMETSGYLPIDRIVVRRFKDDEKYVVLEGNRRITAAKRLWELHENGDIDLDDRVVDSLREIPVLVYTGTDPDAAWVFQGIRHISGVRDWSAYNKAKLLVEQMEEQGLNFTEAGRIFGVSRYQAAQWVRGYYAYLQAKDHPDFHRGVDTRIFPYLQELFGRSSTAVKNWMGWNEEEGKFEDEDRSSEFFSWLYPKLTVQGEFDPDLPGDWDGRWVPRAIDLRRVAELMSKYPDEFLEFRQGRASLNLALARAEAKEKPSEEVKDYAMRLDSLAEELGRLPIAQIRIEKQQELILEKIDAISGIVAEVRRLLEV